MYQRIYNTKNILFIMLKNFNHTALMPHHENYFAGPKAKYQNEFSQAVIRLGISIIALFINLFHYFKTSINPSLTSYGLIFLLIGHSVVSISFSIYVKNNLSSTLEETIDQKNSRKIRNWFNLILDEFLVTLILITTGNYFAIFLAVYVWLPLDHGLRFGKKYIYAGAVFSIFGLIILMIGPFSWPQFKFVGLGLILNIIFTCIYASRSLDKMRSANIELGQLASKDILTNLPNRRYFMSRLSYAMKSTDRTNFYIGCLFIDLDGFKKVNDDHGHAIGDELLKKISMTLNECVTDTEIIARIGGDEFAVLTQYIKNPLEVLPMCEKIIDKIGNIRKIEDCPIHITASIGAILYKKENEPDMTDSDLVSCADNAMYGAKNNGKNQIFIALGTQPAKDVNKFKEYFSKVSYE